MAARQELFVGYLRRACRSAEVVKKDEANVSNKATCRKSIRNVTQRFGAHKWIHELE